MVYTALYTDEYFAAVMKTPELLFVDHSTFPLCESMQWKVLLADATNRRDSVSSISIVLTMAVCLGKNESKTMK